MSSHHIIREDQEPALLILGEIRLTKIEPLLEWSPLVLVADVVLDAVVSWGIKIDVVLTEDREQANALERLKHQAPLKILSSEHQSGHLRNALYFLIAGKHRAVHIAGTLSAGLQKELTEFGDRIQITFLEDTYRWLLIAGGSFKKWFPQGTTLKVTKSQPTQEVRLEGLQMNGESAFVEMEGFVVMQSAEAFWVAELNSQ